MSNFYSLNKANFNSSTGKSLEKIFRQLSIFLLEAVKALAHAIGHLIKMFLGK